MTNCETAKLVNFFKKRSLRMALNAGKNGAHVGGAFSCMDLLTVLFTEFLRYEKDNWLWPERDRFYLSKGHAVLAYYNMLEYIGAITPEQLDTFEQNGGDFPGHPIKNTRCGIEISSGSLGMGITLATGAAMAGKRKRLSYKCYVLLGDGECDEGTVWEAAMAAAHYKLDNLVVLLDYNGLQSDERVVSVMDLGDIAEKWRAFGWNVQVINGHNIAEIENAFQLRNPPWKPTIIIARTIKGNGISFMENSPEWHHNILTNELYAQAMAELDLVNNVGI